MEKTIKSEVMKLEYNLLGERKSEKGKKKKKKKSRRREARNKVI